MVRALVLAGGGAKGAYQAGVLKKWLLEDKIDYEILCGISVGALNSAMISMVPYGQPDEAYQKVKGIWDRVEDKKIVKEWPWLGKIESIWRKSVCDSEPLLKWIESELDDQAVKASGRKLRIGAVSWDSGRYRAVDENTPNLALWIYSSACFPIFFTPIQIGNEMWTDGGVRNVTPIGDAIRAGADEIDIIICSNTDRISEWDSSGKVTVHYLFRMIDLMSDEIVRNDLQVAGLKNDLAELGKDYKHIKFRIMEPSVPLGDSLSFDPESIQRMMNIGYQDASNV
jgi:NTE family protein